MYRKTPRGVLLLSLTAALVLPCAAADDTAVTFQSLLAEMIDRDALARLPSPAYVARQASSHDRRSKTKDDAAGWFANDDWSRFIRSEKHEGRTEWVMMEDEGPGSIVRMWMGAPSPDYGPPGTLRIYLDGAEKPAVEENADALLSGRAAVGAPFAAVCSIGRNLYLPMPYASRCIVTYDRPLFWESRNDADRAWYVIEYRSYARGTKVASFTRETLARERALVELVGRALCAPDNALAGGTKLAPCMRTRLATGESLAQAFEGPGAIRTLSVAVDAADLPQALRSTLLVLEFDGQETVWCPLGDFFGSGVGLNPYRDWWRVVDRNGLMTCLWVMPFQRSAAVRLVNLGAQPVEAVLGMIGTTAWNWDERSMYFHSTWRQEYPRATRARQGRDWNYVAIRGAGVYVGDTLAIRNGSSGWWGEGDEKIFVDGEAFPSHFGTGTEDYYGYSFGDRGVFFESPFHAQPRAEGNNRPGHTTNTRVRMLDAIPFTKSLVMDMEIWHWETTRMAYAATTYWYARPGATSNRAPAPDESVRPIPGPYVVAGALEGEQLATMERTGGVVEIQRGDPLGWSNDAQLWWRDGNPGERLILAVPVGVAGRYRILARFTKARDYGIFRFVLAGTPLGGELDFYSPNVADSGEIELGTCELTAGTARLEAVIAGANKDAEPRHMLGLDYVRLERVQ